MANLSLIYSMEDGFEWAEYLCEKCKVAEDMVMQLHNVEELFPLLENVKSHIQKKDKVVFLITPAFLGKLKRGGTTVSSFRELLTIRTDTSLPLPYPIALLLGTNEDEVLGLGVNLDKLTNFVKWEKITISSDNLDLAVNRLTQKVTEKLKKNHEQKEVAHTVLKQSTKFRITVVPSITRSNEIVVVISTTGHKADDLQIFLQNGEYNDDNSRIHVNFKLLNKGTFQFLMPELPAGNISVTLLDNGKGLQQTITVKNETLICRFNALVDDLIDPIHLLLNTLPHLGSLEELDNHLVQCVKKKIPEFTSLLFSNDDVPMTESKYSELEMPSLIHFSAKYGFIKLCQESLSLPGAKCAYTIENCNGDFPRNIAQSNGHHHLADLLAVYEDKLLSEDIYFTIVEANKFCSFVSEVEKDKWYLKLSQDFFQCVSSSGVYIPDDDYYYVDMSAKNIPQLESETFYGDLDVEPPVLREDKHPVESSRLRDSDLFLLDDSCNDQMELMYLMKDNSCDGNDEHISTVEDEVIKPTRHWWKKCNGRESKSFKENKDNIKTFRCHLQRCRMHVQDIQPREYLTTIQTIESIDKFPSERKYRFSSISNTSSLSTGSSADSRASFRPSLDSDFDENDVECNRNISAPPLPPRGYANSMKKISNQTAASADDIPPRIPPRLAKN